MQATHVTFWILAFKHLSCASWPLWALHVTAGCMQIDRCFGFDTAVEEAQRALLAAKARRGTAIDKLQVLLYLFMRFPSCRLHKELGR